LHDFIPWDLAQRLVCYFFLTMAAQRESSAEASSWAGISESGDDDMDFEVGPPVMWDLVWVLGWDVVVEGEGGVVG
jgi:hypothetical protein